MWQVTVSGKDSTGEHRQQSVSIASDEVLDLFYNSRFRLDRLIHKAEQDGVRIDIDYRPGRV